MSGLDVLRRLRGGSSPEMDAPVVTAARDVETIRTAMRGGVVHCFIEPFTFDALRDRLERYAMAHRRLSERADALVGQSPAWHRGHGLEDRDGVSRPGDSPR